MCVKPLESQDPNDVTHPTINCGTKWKQSITLDAFGNISKSGSGSFTPTYTSPPTNKYNQLPGGPVGVSNYYNANGNLTNDVTHVYTWDAEGRMVTVDNGISSGVCLTYDALGRMVEQGRGSTCSTYTQIVYSPGGFKLALLTGQTLQKAFVPLTGGATAVYSASGLQYFRHTDWLGSSRLASKPNRTLWFDTAYAPFGEDYAGKTGSGGAVDLSFTGQNKDMASWTYDFLFREYNPAQSRWVSPDPAALMVSDVSDPQSWNRYSYVENAPCSFVDPLGLSKCNLTVGISFSPAVAQASQQTIEKTIQALFGADISLQFRVGGLGQVNIDIGHVPPEAAHSLGASPTLFNGAPSNQGSVDFGKVLSYAYFWLPNSHGQTTQFAQAVGRVAAHELGHELYLGHNFLGGGIMGAAANPFTDVQFSTSESVNLLSRCLFLKNSRGGGGGSRSGAFSARGTFGRRAGRFSCLGQFDYNA